MMAPKARPAMPDHVGGPATASGPASQSAERPSGVRAATMRARLSRDRGIVFRRLSCDAHATVEISLADPGDGYVIQVLLRDVETCAIRVDGQWLIDGPAAGDSAFLYAADDQAVGISATPFDWVSIHLPQAALDDDPAAPVGPRPVALQIARQGHCDALLAGLVRTVLPFFDCPADSGQLFVDSMARVIRTHILRHYGADPARMRDARGGLSPWVERRAKDFIESRLVEGVRLHEIADFCGLSASHFAKAFKLTTGRTPHKWLVERRIERAKSLLKDDSLALAEIADASGFSDSCHFSRTFSQLTREAPAAWRRRNRAGRSVKPDLAAGASAA